MPALPCSSALTSSGNSSPTRAMIRDVFPTWARKERGNVGTARSRAEERRTPGLGGCSRPDAAGPSAAHRALCTRTAASNRRHRPQRGGDCATRSRSLGRPGPARPLLPPRPRSPPLPSPSSRIRTSRFMAAPPPLPGPPPPAPLPAANQRVAGTERRRPAERPLSVGGLPSRRLAFRVVLLPKQNQKEKKKKKKSSKSRRKETPQQSRSVPRPAAGVAA